MSRFKDLQSDSDSDLELAQDANLTISDEELKLLRERREDEILAITTIYGDDCSYTGFSNSDDGRGSRVEVRLRVVASSAVDDAMPLRCMVNPPYLNLQKYS